MMDMDTNDKPNNDQWGGSTTTQIYDQMAKELTRPAAETIVDLANSFVPFNSSGVEVLDNGCGPGIITAEIARRFPNTKILATDLSPGMLQRVTDQNLPGVTTRVVDGMDLSGIRDDHPAGFSHVLSNFMNQFAPDPVKVFEEMIGVARPDDAVIGLSSWGTIGYETVFKLAASRVDPDWESPGCWASKSWPEKADEIKKIFEDHGLIDVQSHVSSRRISFRDVDEYIWYLFNSKNPGLEQFLNDFKNKHGQEGLDRARSLIPVVWKEHGLDLRRDLDLKIFITIGRKTTIDR